MPLSWGYGQVYNHRDIAFSTKQNKTILSQTFTKWTRTGSIVMLKDFLAIEPLIVVPIKNYATNTISPKTRYGESLLFAPYMKHLESYEIGYLVNNDFDESQIYIGVDGSLFTDYTFCSTIYPF